MIVRYAMKSFLKLKATSRWPQCQSEVRDREWWWKRPTGRQVKLGAVLTLHVVCCYASFAGLLYSQSFGGRSVDAPMLVWKVKQQHADSMSASLQRNLEGGQPLDCNCALPMRVLSGGLGSMDEDLFISLREPWKDSKRGWMRQLTATQVLLLQELAAQHLRIRTPSFRAHAFRAI